MILSNAHTHTQFCDAVCSAEQMVQAAIQLGFTSLGFSGHSYHKNTLDYGMSPAGTQQYIQEVHRLQSIYLDRLTIRLGLELDYYSSVDLSPYEYIIGSVHHYLDPETGAFYSYDGSVDSFYETLEKGFHGDIFALARTYYTQVTNLITQKRPAIIGHFNLITKRNDVHHLIDEDDPAYQRLALEALRTCAETGAITEVNTGAIARGYASRPYPNLTMLRFLREHRYPVMINSDCHDASKLNAHFELAVSLLQEAGFHSVMVLGRDSLFEEVGLCDLALSRSYKEEVHQ